MMSTSRLRSAVHYITIIFNHTYINNNNNNVNYNDAQCTMMSIMIRCLLQKYKIISLHNNKIEVMRMPLSEWRSLLVHNL